jgi:hypothetical protein
MKSSNPLQNIREFHNHFNQPVTRVDCGSMCAPFNPAGKPFCCDICQAVPVAYKEEWEYLQSTTSMWHEWHGDECGSDPLNPNDLRAETPDHYLLLACAGPANCQREFRASSCRQFPFFPYITSNYRFIGLAYYWNFEPTCWVLSNLGSVLPEYRENFIQTYDGLFNHWISDLESYAATSEEMREQFIQQKRRIPLLHRNGLFYLISPKSERLTKVNPDQFPHFGVYRTIQKTENHSII